VILKINNHCTGPTAQRIQLKISVLTKWHGSDYKSHWDCTG